MAHHRGDQLWLAPGAAARRLTAPGGNLVERAPIDTAAIAMTTRRHRQLTPSLKFVLTERVAFVLIYRGGRHSSDRTSIDAAMAACTAPRSNQDTGTPPTTST